MQFNVSLLMREPIGSRRRYQADEEFVPVEGERLRVRVQGSVDMLRTDRGILASAHVTSSAEGECDRCLLSVTYPVTMDVEEEFLPTVDPITGGKLPPPVEPEASTIDSHHVLDLTDVVRQSWLLVSPMQVLCRDDCAGLCPECGADKNNRPCACNEAPVDSRWAALSVLRNVNGDHHEEN
ncbi:MAG TPA: DUF177 domain-containing protein [Dehalococcoidia bacterium]